MDRPLVGVNLLYVRPDYQGGTVRYAHELLKHLVRMKEFRWRLYLQEGAFRISDPLLAELPRREFKVVGGLAGRVLIEHLILPVVAQRDGVAVLFSPGFVSPLWGRFRKVVTIHDLYYRLFPEFVRFWQRRYWHIFVPASLRMVDAAIVDSDSTCRDVCSAFPNSAYKIKRIHLGADSLRPINRKMKASSNSFCLVVGNITPNKNVETILEAFSICQARQRNFRLVVAGSDRFGLLAAALRSTYPAPEIEMREHVDDATLAELYLQASCLIQASHYEGFGLPVVEAMMMGCPVIASDIPVLREICGDAAIYFCPRSPEELAAAVEKLVDDDDLQVSIAEKGRKNAQRFRWEKAARETSTLFGAIL